MNCERTRARLVSFHARDLSRAEMGEVGWHLGECPACRDEYAEITATLAAMDRVRPGQEEERRLAAARARLDTALRTAPVPRTARRFVPGWLPRAAAAVLLLAAGATAGRWSGARRSLPEPDPVAEDFPRSDRPADTIPPPIASVPSPRPPSTADGEAFDRILAIAALADLDRQAGTYLARLREIAPDTTAPLRERASGDDDRARAAFDLLTAADPVSARALARHRVGAGPVPGWLAARALDLDLPIPAGRGIAWLDRHPERRNDILDRLARNARPDDLPSLLDGMERHPELRTAAAAAVRRDSSRAAAELAARPERERDRIWSELQGEISDPADRDRLLEVIRRARPETRTWTLRAAAETGSPLAIAWGRSMLADPHRREEAVRILSEHGGETALDILIEGLRFPQVSSAAAAGLERITGMNLGSEWHDWRRWRRTGEAPVVATRREG